MSVDILIFSNMNVYMNVARALSVAKPNRFFSIVLYTGQEDNDSEELTEEPWNYARGDTLEDTKWHQLKIGSLKYFSTLKSDRYKTRPWRGKKEIHPIGKETRSALLNLGSLWKKEVWKKEGN